MPVSPSQPVLLQAFKHTSEWRMAPVIVEGSHYYKNQPEPSGQEEKTIREASVCV